MNKPKLTVIVGPTASGKTDYTIQLAQQGDGEIVSADSRQVYRGMDIGTAKIKDTQGIPHHLVDIRGLNQPLSLAEWQAAAFQVIDRVLTEGRQPLLVGGTMLYIDSVIYNFDIPQVAPALAFRESKEKIEGRKLYEELLEKDPEVKNFIEPSNKRRIIRALEVMEATGKPFSSQRKRQEPRYETQIIGLFPRQAGGQAGWDELKRRIEVRAKKMFAEGLLEETQGLREKYGKDLPLLQTLNYRQAGAVLDGTLTQDAAVESMVKDTMRYAHRQMSWWKGRKEIEWREK